MGGEGRDEGGGERGEVKGRGNGREWVGQSEGARRWMGGEEGWRGLGEREVG